MHKNLQAILTRVSVSVLLVLGASAGAFAQELSEEADALFDRRAYFEASSDYVAAYAKKRILKTELTALSALESVLEFFITTTKL